MRNQEVNGTSDDVFSERQRNEGQTKLTEAAAVALAA